MCAHNEEKYVGKCLAGVEKALRGVDGEVIFVADRCTDNTVNIAMNFNVSKLVNKTWRRWNNSYAESLQVGFLNSSGKYVSIVDADILIPENFFDEMLPLIKGNIASVSAKVETYPSTLLNSIINIWEKTHNVTPFLREPRGAARIIRREILHKIGGFKDTPAPDTDIDIRLRKAGYQSVYNHRTSVWHLRENTLSKVVSRQLSSGAARYNLKIGFMRTLAHSVFRLRPLVIYGWFIEKLRKSENQ
ncbi:MAG: glycosyltransferase [Nitrososphaerota archaeon]